MALLSFLRLVWVRAAPELLYICPISIIQSGTQSQDAGLGTLVTGPCWCTLLFSVRLLCVSFRCPWEKTLVSGILTLSEHILFYWGWSARRRTKRSTEDWALFEGWNVRRRTGALFSRRGFWRRTERSTQGGTVNSRLNARRKAEHSNVGLVIWWKT